MDNSAASAPVSAAATAAPVAPDTVRDTLTLHTDLLGDLQVPGGAGRSAELEALAARAAVYATARAATVPAAFVGPPGAATPPGANRSAASRWPAIRS